MSMRSEDESSINPLGTPGGLARRHGPSAHRAPLTKKDLSSNDPSLVCITRDDAIDAIGALELRADERMRLAKFWHQEGQPGKALEWEERAEETKGVIERIREAMKQ